MVMSGGDENVFCVSAVRGDNIDKVEQYVCTWSILYDEDEKKHNAEQVLEQRRTPTSANQHWFLGLSLTAASRRSWCARCT